MAYGVYELFLGLGQIAIFVTAVPFYLICLAGEFASYLFCQKRRSNPNSVLITGGASGIGLQLAKEYVSRGTKHVFLSDLNADALKKAAAEIKAVNPQASVLTEVIDVRNREQMWTFICAADRKAPLDVCHANAGVADSSAALDAFLDLERSAHLITEINVCGVVNTVLPALACMRARGEGQIVVTSSLSAFPTYLNSIPSYAASKAWAKSWTLGLRAHFWSTGVRFSALCPGFIETPMVMSVPEKTKDGVATQWRKNGVPGLVSVEWAVKRFVDGLAMDKAVVTFPAFMFWASHFLSHSPLPVMDFLLRITPERLSFFGFGATRKELVSPTPTLFRPNVDMSLKPLSPAPTPGAASRRVSSSSGMTSGEIAVASPRGAGSVPRRSSSVSSGKGRSKSPTASSGGRRKQQ